MTPPPRRRTLPEAATNAGRPGRTRSLMGLWGAPVKRSPRRTRHPSAEWLEQRALLATIHPGDVVVAKSRYAGPGRPAGPSVLEVIDRRTGAVTPLPQPFGTTTGYGATAVGADGDVYTSAGSLGGNVTGAGFYKIDPASPTPVLLFKPTGVKNFPEEEELDAVTTGGDLIRAYSAFEPGKHFGFPNGQASSLDLFDPKTGHPTGLPQPFGGGTVYSSVVAGLDGTIYLAATPLPTDPNAEPPVPTYYRVDPSAGTVTPIKGGFSGEFAGAGAAGQFVTDTATVTPQNQEVETLTYVDPAGAVKTLDTPFGAGSYIKTNARVQNAVSFGSDGTFLAVVYQQVGYFLGNPALYEFDPTANTFSLFKTPAPFDAVAVAVAPSEAASLSVTAAQGDNGDTTFGPFLTGVPLPDTFTVTPEDLSGVVKSVQYRIDGAGPLTATPAGAGHWTFDPKVDKLPASGPKLTDTLTVTALDANGKQVASYTGTFQSQNDVHETLKITPPGGQGGGMDVANLRFVQKVSLPSQFTGTLADLPGYYKPELQVVLDGKPLTGVTVTSAGPGVQFSFPYDPKDLTGDQNVFPVFRVNQNVAPAPGADATAKLHSVPLPKWLTGSPAVFDPKQDAYVIKPQALTLTKDFGTTSGFPAFLDLFNGLASSVSVGLDLTLTAKLTKNDGDAKLTAGDYHGNVTFLGTSLLAVNSSLNSGYFHLAPGDPNADTLDAPADIKLTTDPIPLTAPKLFNLPFGTGAPKPLPLPVPTPFGVDIALNGAFRAAVRKLTLQAGLDLDVSGATPMLKSPGSFVELVAEGDASLVLNATGSLGFKVIKFPLISAVIAGGVSASANADVKVNFAGAITNPEPALDSDSMAGVTFGYGFDWDYGTLETVKVKDLKPDIQRLPKAPLTAYPLFGLKAPPAPDFEALKALILNGPGNLIKPGQPFLGKGTTTTTPPGIKAQAVQPPAPITTLTVDSPVYAPLTDLTFGVDVVADHARLTPGRHFLDAVLVGPDGGEVPVSHTDLAAPALSAASNSLGFASGFTTIDAKVPASALAPGLPYRVEFRLYNDAAGTGQTVSVALENLSTVYPTPALTVSAGGGTPGPGGLDFGSSATQTVTLANTGQASLLVNSLSIAGAGFTLTNPPGPDGFTVPAGESSTFQVKVLDPTRPAGAALVAASDDPSRPSYRLALTYSGGGGGGGGAPAGPTVAAIAGQTVRVGTPVRFTATASEPGRSVRYSLAPGAPAGATIDPATGAFAWTPDQSGTYTLTVRATDDASPPALASTSFTVTVTAAAVGVAPVVSLAPAAVVAQGATFLDAGSVADASAGPFQAVVNYGDGTGTQPLSIGPRHAFTLAHAYAAAGTNTVTVGVTNPSGLAGGGTLAVAVAAAPPAPLPSGYGVGRDVFVTTFYAEALGRVPESGGLRYWSGRLYSGASPRSVARAIWDRPERLARAGRAIAPAATLGRAYADALRAGRTAARSGVVPPAGPPTVMARRGNHPRH